MVTKLIQFFQHDIWRMRLSRVSGIKASVFRGLRVFIISVREFASDQCILRASALTFYSLLSIVPVFAMAFGFAKGFGMDKMLKRELLENMEGQQEVVTRIIEFSENMLQNTKGGLVAGIGLLFLFWTVIKVLGNIESSFNDIWGIKKGRSIGRKFTDYLSFMLIAPTVFLFGSSLSVFVVSQVRAITESVSILGAMAPVILPVLKLVSYGVFWGLLTFLYMFMPNTKINFKSALIGGIVAGTAYQLTQWGYIHFQVGAAKAGAIYGSFAALPLFLIWLQISWFIVLYGAELAFAHQNQETFEFEPDCLNASRKTEKLLSLYITQLCVNRFSDGLAALAAEQIASQLEIPIRLARKVLFDLTEAGILTRMTEDNEKSVYYQPARDVSDMTVSFVLDRLDEYGSGSVPVAETAELAALRNTLDVFQQSLQQLPLNKTFKQLHAEQASA